MHSNTCILVFSHVQYRESRLGSCDPTVDTVCVTRVRCTRSRSRLKSLSSSKRSVFALLRSTTSIVSFNFKHLYCTVLLAYFKLFHGYLIL